jgi:hypothetical protein
VKVTVSIGRPGKRSDLVAVHHRVDILAGIIASSSSQTGLCSSSCADLGHVCPRLAGIQHHVLDDVIE